MGYPTSLFVVLGNCPCSALHTGTWPMPGFLERSVATAASRVVLGACGWMEEGCDGSVRVGEKGWG